MGCNKCCERGPFAFLFTAYAFAAAPVNFYLAVCGGHWGWGGMGATAAGAVMAIPFDVHVTQTLLTFSDPTAVGALTLDNPITFEPRGTWGTVPIGNVTVAPAGSGFQFEAIVAQDFYLLAGDTLGVAYANPGQLGGKNLGATMVVSGVKL